MANGSIPTTFTPCLDPLLREYGPIGACVYGKVWGYAQMSDGVCKAAQETIAAQINVTRRTVWRWINILCQDGYLKDLTPTLKNKPHEYRITDKPATVQSLHSERKSQPTVNESHSHCVIESPEEILQQIPEKIEDQESAVADVPHNFPGWHSYIREAENRSDTIHRLRKMCETLYPGLDPPSHQYVGIVAKRLHAGRLADLLWQSASHPPTGDLLAYIQGVAKNGKNRSTHTGLGEGNGTKATTGQAAAIAKALMSPVHHTSGGGKSGA